MLDERLAAHVGAPDPLRGKVTFDDHLGGDAGMIGADNPQRVLALQARVTREDILQRIVERVADVQ